MRLIIKSAIFFLLTLTIGELGAQVQVDTVDIDHTFLEDRHLRYMYNFALNSALFQYEGGGNPGVLHYDHIYEDDRVIQIITDERSPEVSNLEAFIFPAEFCYLKYLKGTHQMAFQFPLKSQYHIEYLPEFDDISSTEKLLKTYQILEDNKKSVFAMEFSGLYLNRNRFYLEVVVYIRYNYPTINGQSTFYFEFDWCESRKVVYPIRTNERHVPEWNVHPPMSWNQPRHSPTIEIPALLCPIVE